jgi:hypothetical protein
MKQRLHGKKAGIAILAALILITVGEMIFRAVALKEAILPTQNLGEPVVLVALSLLIIALTLKGKDRACYILYGAWIGFFVFEQLFELPAVIIGTLAHIHYATGNALVVAAMLLRVFSMLCIVAIGALLVEYMIDGTIYNKAFNILCCATVLMLSAYAVLAVLGCIQVDVVYLLAVFNVLAKGVMVFLFAFFAYDSAKMQLKKANLEK